MHYPTCLQCIQEPTLAADEARRGNESRTRIRILSQLSHAEAEARETYLPGVI